MRRSAFFALLILVLTAVSTQRVSGQDAQSPFLGDLQHYVETVLNTFEVPGLSIAIVKDGVPVLTKGYGVKKLGGTESVDEHTLFPIASNTKAFTATALALLVEEGKLEWDKPVITYLPWFRMSDPYVTSQLTIRDLLVHRSGLAPYAGDLLWFPPTTFSREEIVRRIRWLPLATSFRSSYAYDNILYMVAGEVIEAVSWQQWEAFVESRILGPLGMDESITRFSKLIDQPNRSASHARFNGEVRIIHDFLERGLDDVTNPAGGIASNAVDMSQWLITQLDSGRVVGSGRLFDPRTTEELWTGVTPIPVRDVAEDLKPTQRNFHLYGLGFHISDYRSYKTVAHGGKLDGHVSRVMLVPDLKLGIIILTNQESTYAIYAILNHILDHYMGTSPFDWITPYKEHEKIRFARIEKTENQAVASRDTASQPSLPLPEYTGIFRDAWYGDVKITMEDGHLVMRFRHTPELVGDMEHWQYDTFIVRWRNRGLKADAYVVYSLKADGSIDRIKMKAVSPVTDVSYDFRHLLLKPVSEQQETQ